MKQTKPEHNGASQLIPSVGLTRSRCEGVRTAWR